MFQFTPLLLAHCLYLISSGNVHGSSVQTGVMMCQRWCERRSSCSEATYDPNLLQCSLKKEKHVPSGLIVIPIQQHLCEKCPTHHVCLRIRSGATKCVKEDTTGESKIGPKSARQGTFKGSKQQPALDTLQECRGNIRYVQLQRPKIIRDFVYYHLSANCPEVKSVKLVKQLMGTFGMKRLAERKIYYWLMTLDIDWIVSLKETLSFKVVFTNPLKVASTGLSLVTVTVDKNSITFKSRKTKSDSNVPDRIVVVVDKIKGRFLLGTRKTCYAMVNGIEAKQMSYPMIKYPFGHPPNLDRLLFDSISGNEYNFTYEDVKNLMRRCEKQA